MSFVCGDAVKYDGDWGMIRAGEVGGIGRKTRGGAGLNLGTGIEEAGEEA